MEWVDRRVGVLVVAMVAAGAFAAPPDQSTYGKVETFEPGKKYNCVPSADRKSWDCTETGKATNADVHSSRGEPPPAAANPPPIPASTPPPEAPPPSAAAAPAAAGAHSSELPSYLSAAAASGRAPSTPRPVPASAPNNAIVPEPGPKSAISTNPQVPPPAASAPVTAQTPATPASVAPATTAPEPVHEPAPTPKPVAALPAAAPEPAVAPPPRPATVSSAAAGSGHDFLALPGDQYVIELAHGESEAAITAVRTALNLPHGEAYEVHSRQNGADLWLLVWGSFDDIGAARAARTELPADAHVGWPRRIAPLQAEVRRTQE